MEIIGDAPYGLTKLSGLAYGQTDFTTGTQSFNTDLKVFGLRDVPPGLIVLQGTGSDKLFATDIATAMTDLSTSTVKAEGIYSIIGGEGRFKGTTGALNFTEVGNLSLNSNDLFIGQASVNGSFQVVPEPSTDTALIAIGVIGSCILLHQHRRKSTRKHVTLYSNCFASGGSNPNPIINNSTNSHSNELIVSTKQTKTLTCCK